ncbi:MAG: ribonuclease III [bacterium]|nr:ribonuclease III [bacterium]
MSSEEKQKISPERREVLRTLEEKLAYRFQSLELLETALTHDSFAHENPGQNIYPNERLEFLGDAVLGLVAGHELYRLFPQADEGTLTKMRAALVSQERLAEIARRMELGEFLNLSQGEKLAGGREKESIIAEALEAVFGAVYLDGGMEAAREKIEQILNPLISDLVQGRIGQDFKSKLQEIIQERFKKPPSYRIVSESGPSQARVFQAEVNLPDSSLSAAGTGRTKRSAEQAAAKALLEKLENGNNARP